jgi:hypothetical protein
MTSSRRAFACAGALACGLFAAACDPKEAPPASENGPPFLVVGLASAQPATPDAGTAVYVQSRGGNYVGFVTHGCTLAFGPYEGVTESCGLTAYYGNAPLYLFADPEDEPCKLEVRLYSICDCIDAAIPYDYSKGDSVFEWCDSTGTPVTTQVLALGPPAVDASDAASDAGPPDGDGAPDGPVFSGDSRDP